MISTKVSIPGIHCASCAATIKDISADFPQIKNVDVDIDGKIVTLEHEDGFDLAAWSEEIGTLGETYTVTTIS
jgi:copper chaperone CopZ